MLDQHRQLNLRIEEEMIAGCTDMHRPSLYLVQVSTLLELKHRDLMYSFTPPDEDPAKYDPSEETFSCIADAFDAFIMSQRILIDDVTLPADGCQAIAEVRVMDLRSVMEVLTQTFLLQMEPLASNLLRQRIRRRTD